LQGKLPLSTCYRFSDVVFNGLREVPSGSRQLGYFAIHSSDQFLLVFPEYGPPLRFWLEIDEVFGVPESTGVGSVVGTADFRDHLSHFRERSEDQASLVHKARAFSKVCAL